MYRFRQLVFTVITMILCYAFSGVAQATPFTNGSFDSGFSGWSGSFVDPFTVVAPEANPSMYSLSGVNSAAQLQNNDTDWIVTLFQGFTVDSLTSPANKLTLSFSIKWQPTDSGVDGVSATLGGVDLLAGTTGSQLFGGTDLSVDVTSLAGSVAELGFTIMDSDFLTPDFLWIDNIAFNQVVQDSAPVPEPGTIVLLTVGFVSIAFVKGRKRATL